MEDNGREMASALYGAQVVVLFLSEGFCDSKWCVMEANAALRRELDENRHLVLPVYDSPQVFATHRPFKPLHHKSSIIRREGLSDREFVCEVIVPSLLQLPYQGVHPLCDRAQLEKLMEEYVHHPDTPRPVPESLLLKRPQQGQGQGQELKNESSDSKVSAHTQPQQQTDTQREQRHKDTHEGWGQEGRECAILHH
jgi:hypothetical protein